MSDTSSSSSGGIRFVSVRIHRRGDRQMTTRYDLDQVRESGVRAVYPAGAMKRLLTGKRERWYQRLFRRLRSRVRP